jgi:hypothetical protein
LIVPETTVSVESPHGVLLRVPPRFEFQRDSFAFANELIWAYHFDPVTGKTTVSRRAPEPTYAHRCFVLSRAARQFLYHSRFDAGQQIADDKAYRRLIRRVLARNPRALCEPGQTIVIPGFDSLRRFSQARETLLKAECGGAWRSYCLRSHWRMVFPVSRQHQVRTAGQLLEAIRHNRSPIVHLVRFPALSINHGMLLFAAEETDDRVRFHAYDPNDPNKPVLVSFDRSARTFALSANAYWAGGHVDIIEIYRTWLL